MNSRSFYFYHVSQNPQLPPEVAHAQWIFLGEDYSEFLRWKKIMPPSSKALEFKGDLDEAIAALSKPFSDIITELGKAHDSPAWWSSRISEKNNLVSPLFLHCCYLSVFNKMAEKYQAPLVVIAEDYDLLKCCEAIALSKAKVAVRALTLARYQEYARRLIYALGRMVKFKARCWQLRWQKSSDIPEDRKKDVVLIHTHIDESCLGQDGQFKDRYFGHLSSWLNDKGYNAITLPVLFNMRRTPEAIWEFLRQASGFFINPFEYYSLLDYVFVFKESLRQQLIDFRNIKLIGLDVTRLFKAEQRRKAFACLDPLLYHRLPRALTAHGFQIARVIMPFENMVEEKMFNLGLKIYSSGTISVGYQHSTLWPTLMCQFVSSQEAAFAPLSDKIVCNGAIFLRILAEKGLPKEKLVLGPALRYAYLSNKKSQEPQAPIADALVTLPLMKSDAAELLMKVIEAFRQQTQLKILIKPHPMIEKIWLSDMTAKLMIPGHFSIVEGSMDERVKQVKMVIGMSSGTLMEVYAAGKPLIVVGRNTSIDFNPLGFLPGFDRIYVSPQEIEQRALAILNQDQWTTETKDIFSPVSDELMGAFLSN